MRIFSCATLTRLGALAVTVSTGIFSGGEPARAVPLQYAGTGNYYEFVFDVGISWQNASTAAAGSSYLGVSGHLATVTSAGENGFLVALIAAPSDVFAGGWLGGTSDNANVWTWAVGPEAGQAFSYTNWNPAEQNNPPAGLYMNIGLTGPNGGAAGQWYDAGGGISTGASGADPVVGYFVEYEVNAVPLPAALPLFASGLGALGLLGWRRKRKTAAGAG
jgi:PEP-CTERM motif